MAAGTQDLMFAKALDEKEEVIAPMEAVAFVKKTKHSMCYICYIYCEHVSPSKSEKNMCRLQMFILTS